jgi:endonuclease-3 related protein
LRTSIELLEALKKCVKIDEKNPWWWPNSGTFEVVVGAILTQRSSWQRVQEVLERLQNIKALHVDTMAAFSKDELSQILKPCGFYAQKADKLIRLSQNIKEDFGDFETFKTSVDRQWLLRQKGVGPESADAILCYACQREAMVVDRYTAILLNYYGFEFETYEELQSWFLDGLDEKKLRQIYANMPRGQVYARFHGKIVEFCKGRIKKGELTQGVPGLSPD